MSAVNGRRLSDHYAVLDPQERFRLALEAGARGDDEERELLVSSAAMCSYRITDPAYQDRVDASRELALAVALDLGPRLSQLRLIRAAREALPRAVALGVECGLRSSGGEAPTPEEVREVVDETLAETLGELESQLRSRAAAVLAAFREVCRADMGLDAETVLSAHLGPLLVVQLAIDELKGVKPDDTALDRRVFQAVHLK